MTHVKNNAIALGVHILLCGCFSLLYTFLDGYFPYDESIMLAVLLTVIVCIFGYLACGFFLLRPVERFPFLSVSSLAILIVIVDIIIVNQEQYRCGGYGEALFLTNPVICIMNLLSFMGIPSIILQMIGLVVLFLGPLFPSLLLFLGMFLGKKFRKAKAQQGSAV